MVFHQHSSNQKFQQSRQLKGYAILAAILLQPFVDSSIALALPHPQQIPQFSQAQQNQAPQNQAQPATRLPRSVVRRVKQEIAQNYNIPPRNLTIVHFSRETWTDGCLGLGGPAESCLAAMVEGWRVEVSNGQQNWVYRTDLTGQTVRPEVSTNTSELPPELNSLLLQTIAREKNTTDTALSVTEAQPATWDGCMGIFAPGRMCTQIAISGWRAIVTDGNQSWVYHLSEDGSRIVQNTTASGSSGGLVPTFRPLDQPPENQGATLVFCFTESGGFAGMVTERFLTSDGAIHRQTRRLNELPAGDAVVEKQLTPEQLAQFQQVLMEQEFPNLNRLKYISSASLADYPTITLQALGSSVEYTDLEFDHLPVALQTVIQAWQQL